MDAQCWSPPKLRRTLDLWTWAETDKATSASPAFLQIKNESIFTIPSSISYQLFHVAVMKVFYCQTFCVYFRSISLEREKLLRLSQETGNFNVVFRTIGLLLKQQTSQLSLFRQEDLFHANIKCFWCIEVFTMFSWIIFQPKLNRKSSSLSIKESEGGG